MFDEMEPTTQTLRPEVETHEVLIGLDAVVSRAKISCFLSTQTSESRPSHMYARRYFIVYIKTRWVSWALGWPLALKASRNGPKRPAPQTTYAEGIVHTAF